MKINSREYSRRNGDRATFYFVGDDFSGCQEYVDANPEIFGNRDDVTQRDIDASQLRDGILIDLQEVGYCDVKA